MKLLSFLFCWIIFTPLLAQEGSSDQDLLRQRLSQELLLNGKEYRHYYPRTKGKQYISDEVIVAGNLWYEGVYYQDLRLNYDIYNNLLFVAFVNNSEKIYLILNHAKIQAFDLLGMSFVNLPDSSYQGLDGGIYEEAFRQGERLLFIKHKKSLTKEVDTLSDTLQKFDRKTSYYLVENGIVYRIRGKKDLIKALGEDPEFEYHLKQNKLKLRKRRSDFEHNLLQALRFQPEQD